MIQFRSGVFAAMQNDSRAYSQLGHGGYDADGNHSGNITVIGGNNAGVGLDFRAGNADADYTQLGHGGLGARSGTAVVPQGLTGNISITSTGGANFIAGAGFDDAGHAQQNDDRQLYAQLGHGGYDADPSDDNVQNDTDANWGHTGDISLTANGDINVLGGSHDRGTINGVDFSVYNSGGGGGGRGRINYAQIGHGGGSTKGNHGGAMKVDAGTGSIYVLAGNAIDNDVTTPHYAQIGHGGASFNWGGGNGTGDVRGNLSATSVSGETVAANGMDIDAGGDIFVQSAASRYAYTQIGLGGWNRRGAHTGDLSVNAGGAINFTGSTQAAYVGDNRAYTQLGHGGYEADGQHSGSITVGAGAGGITFQAGNSEDDYAPTRPRRHQRAVESRWHTSRLEWSHHGHLRWDG